ncbi:hypothetical protein R1sor_018127 [Riccia sorocarpa]|uniref:Uncharacterized protein n=1 Tax=Riccia sorocarpa TaxID=122646 RepID=A0ABD3ICD2_9MARC
MTTLPGGLDLLEPVSAADNVLESEPISITVGTGWPKDRKMSASTALLPSEDVTVDPGEGDKEDWDEKDFILPIVYFVEDCKLPGHGIHHAELPKNLVSDEQRFSLVQVIDGHEKSINGTIGIIFPRALYAERILGQKINWGAFAHDKLKNQIKAQKTRKLPKPIGPPCIRTPRVYTPPKSLKFDDNDVLVTTPMLEVDAAEAKDKGKLTERARQAGLRVLQCAQNSRAT